MLIKFHTKVPFTWTPNAQKDRYINSIRHKSGVERPVMVTAAIATKNGWSYITDISEDLKGGWKHINEYWLEPMSD